MASSNQYYKSGSILVEILMAIALMAVIAPIIIDGLITTRQGEPQQSQRLQALALNKSTQESMRIIRERGWSSISTNGTFHPSISSGTWNLISGTDTVGDFSRSITISDVYRDSNGSIGTSGNIDPSTKKAITSISWQLPNPSELTTVSYFTRYLENIAHIETTYNNFSTNVGSTTGITINYTNGDPVDGDISLGGGGHGDWCKPNLSIYGFNLNHSASARAITAKEGRVYAGTGGSSSGLSFYDIVITDTNPPTATSEGTLDGYKTNGVFGDDNYGYIATDSLGKQGVIIDLATHTDVGWLNTQVSSSRGRTLTVVGDLVYLSASNKKIYIFDTSIKTGTHTNIAVSPTLSGIPQSLAVVGDILYAVLDSTSNQLAIIPLTNSGRSLGTVSYVSVPGQSGRSLFVKDDASRAYLATAISSSQSELFIIDTNSSSPTYKNILGNYDTSGMDPQGVSMATNNKVVVVGVGGVEYQVIDVANDVITNCSGTLGDFDVNIYGISSVVENDGDAYSYIITSDSNSEFKIIEGGPSGKVGTSGIYESPIFDPGYSTAFNRLFATTITPSGTSLNFQVAIADPVSGSCDNAAYVYRDVESSGAIPLDDDNTGYENPAQCFRYKIFFDSTSAGTTPIVYDVTVNISP